MVNEKDQDPQADQPEAGWSTDDLGYFKNNEERQRVFVFCPYLSQKKYEGLARSPEARLEEAKGLALAIDIDLVGAEIVPLRTIKPASYLGKGKLEEIHTRVKAEEVDLVVFDCELSPIQQRNLERDLNVKVIDRTALILEIFGARASTKEGELQVELAHLTYQRSRLVRSWTHLERQRGGGGFLGGPGETQIESDRRIIADRIVRIKKQLEAVTKTRGLHRARRQKAPYPVVALVGYTNAGKSTLFNRLTDSNVKAEDMLFATLDPTLRSIDLPSGRKIILSDTVGFISELPTMLVAAFRATLEEVLEAEIIVHVRDGSHPDSDVQKQDVIEVLQELGVDLEDVEKGTPVLEALNKLDLLDEDGRDALVAYTVRHDEAMALSAITGEGNDALITAIDQILSEQDYVIEQLVPYSDGATQSWIHANARITSEEHNEDGVRFCFTVDPVAWAKFTSRN